MLDLHLTTQQKQKENRSYTCLDWAVIAQKRAQEQHSKIQQGTTGFPVPEAIVALKLFFSILLPNSSQD